VVQVVEAGICCIGVDPLEDDGGVVGGHAGECGPTTLAVHAAAPRRATTCAPPPPACSGAGGRCGGTLPPLPRRQPVVVMYTVSCSSLRFHGLARAATADKALRRVVEVGGGVRREMAKKTLCAMIGYPF
jgi:hypothetical protein